MATIASLVVDLTARTSKFTSNISKARQPVEQLRLHIERTQRSIDGLTRTSRRMALWGGATFTALAKAGSKMVNLASEAEQLNNVINRTFGHMAAEVNQWAEDTGNALGRSTHSMRSYAGYMQALLRPMVGVTETAAEMSMSLAELAVDLAAFYDTEDQEAFDALRSALVGQTQPLKRYGVAMTQATLQAYAYEKGIKKSIQTMTEAEKVQLRYQYILDQTRLVQGTALAEADEYANVQKALSEEFREQAETIGHILKPAYQWVLEQGRELIRWFDRLEDSTKANIVQVGLIAGALVGFVAALGVAGMGIAAMVKGLLLLGTVFAFITSPLVIGLTLIALGVAGLKTAWDNNWGGIQDKTLEVVDAILVKWNELAAWWETSDFGQAVRKAWSDIVAVWTSDELTLPQKAIETVSIVANTIADLIPSIRAIWNVWTDDDLSLAQKTLATVSIIAGSVSGLIESITTWWINTTVTLAEKVVTMLGLNPDENAFVGFLRQLQTIWNNEELTLGEKVIESLDLIPGVRALQTFYQKLSEIWTNDRITFGAKVVDTIELLADTAIVKIVLATLAGVAVWKILPAVYSALSAAITFGAGKLAAGGLVLGKIAIASVLLVLGAGAIGWVFGDKEGRDAWVEAIKESVRQIDLDEPITVPIAIMDTVSIAFDFGAEGLRKARAKVAELREELSLWEPGVTEAPEWTSDLAESALKLGMSLAEFIGEGFLLVFDIGRLIGTAIAKGTVAAVESIINFGKALGSALVESIVDRLPDWLKGWLGIENAPTAIESTPPVVDVKYLGSGSYEEIFGLDPLPQAKLPITDYERVLLAALAQLEAGIDGVEGMSAVVEVVFNRMKTNAERYGGTIEEVIRKANQFEPVMNGKFDNLLASGNIAAEALEAVDLALRRLAEGAGITGGATYFANLDIVRKRNPNHWMLDPTKMVPTLTIGGHTFGVAGYRDGGYTGNYPVDEIVGVVHGQEIVIPAPAVRKGLPGILEWLGVPGFQTGRMMDIPGLGTAKSIVLDADRMFGQIGQTILSGLTTLFEIIASAIEALAIALVGEEKVEEIKTVFESMRTALEEFRKTLGYSPDDLEPDDEPSLWARIVARLRDFAQALNVTAHAQNFLNSVLQQINPVAQLFSALMSDLTPIINTLMVPIKLTAEVFAALLLPALKLLFPPLKLLGIVLITVAEMVGSVWNALMDLLSMIPFVNLKQYKVDLEDLSDAKRTLIDLTWEDAEKMAELNKEIGEALRNVPQGLKIVSHRLAAAGYSAPGVQAVARQETGGGGTNEIHVHFEGDVYGFDDFKRRVQRIVAEGDRQLSLATHGVS